MVIAALQLPAGQQSPDHPSHPGRFPETAYLVLPGGYCQPCERARTRHPAIGQQADLGAHAVTFAFADIIQDLGDLAGLSVSGVAPSSPNSRAGSRPARLQGFLSILRAGADSAIPDLLNDCLLVPAWTASRSWVHPSGVRAR